MALMAQSGTTDKRGDIGGEEGHPKMEVFFREQGGGRRKKGAEKTLCNGCT